jgi:hypothetical protein
MANAIDRPFRQRHRPRRTWIRIGAPCEGKSRRVRFSALFAQKQPFRFRPIPAEILLAASRP